MKIFIIVVALVICAATIFFCLFGNAPTQIDANTAKADKILAVEPISQFPSLPTGCEAVAAVTVMRYLGSSMTPERFADEWLECNNDFYTDGDSLFGPDPNAVFAGDPKTANSFGCYGGAIVRAVNDFSLSFSAELRNPPSLDTLCEQYIDNGAPVLVWVTIGMRQSSPGRSWVLPDGSIFTWMTGEHCMVLIGYNKNFYFFCDPQSGGLAAFEKSISQKRFEELGCQAVIINKRNPSA
ncbi:MAG: C39 family peptidase [Clostridia bacterium]|nr:C39 family peptidase [Clostridia bacterium]